MAEMEFASSFEVHIPLSCGGVLSDTEIVKYWLIPVDKVNVIEHDPAMSWAP